MANERVQKEFPAALSTSGRWPVLLHFAPAKFLLSSLGDLGVNFVRNEITEYLDVSVQIKLMARDGWMDGPAVMGWERREKQIFHGSLTPVPVKVLYFTATA